MPAPKIRANYEQLELISRILNQQGQVMSQTLSRLRRQQQTLESGEWIGQGARKFYQEMDSAVLPSLQRLSRSLSTAAQVTRKISQIMKQAEEDAARLFVITGAGTIGAAAAARAEAAGLDESGRQSWRDRRSDRRGDRRFRSDERWRRPPGGRRGGSHLDYDWAGGAILERYLEGGGDWHINSDPEWTEYMQSNELLTQDLGNRAVSDAQRLYTQAAAGGSSQLSVNESYAAQMENGEGVVGYQYLHGTNANVGGFERQGTATIEPDGSGGHNVTMDMTYTWNDVIDPNPQYVTDNWKSRLAEIITLGQAEAYEIHITWTERTVVNLDASGNVTEIRNE